MDHGIKYKNYEKPRKNKTEEKIFGNQDQAEFLDLMPSHDPYIMLSKISQIQKEKTA